jgi:hypothetical protein
VPTKPREYYYTRQTLADLLGVEVNTIAQHIKRGYVRPSDLASVVEYVAHYAPEEFRQKIVVAAVRRPETLDPGGWKKGKRSREAK